MLSPADTAQSLFSGMSHKAKMPIVSVIFLSIMAGGSIAMGDIFWAHSTVGVAKASSPGIANFIGGVAFSVGLMMVVFFGGHLFTSSLMTGVSTIDHKLTFSKMIAYWVIVWIFNFIGAAVVAYMYYRSQLPLKYDGEILHHFLVLGVGKNSLSFEAAFIRGIFCNVFVCMAVWAATGASDAAGKVLSILFIIAAFVGSGYEHVVANMFIFTEALLAKAYYLHEVGGTIQALSEHMNISVEKLEALSFTKIFPNNLLPVTLGNIVGGLFFVGVIGFMSHKTDMKK
ncbi:formate/nitrite transporter [Arcobacter nitrofigilis DSM 7299]|jgi:formate/nitrite transporter|uniref:Formate/nitrite transporter n=1 Tax=Arcobacter nitrofigilis (strain ATCC 33309 / DSM 7299 / CCUG 15893 / LMG 7604 / NCTC 12251 / CI) TaxID=572480 RepID=D5V2H2_ARCNC|nr:formate/nitrite transporter family protein [Arcobacter nitrofigilis]ADG92405.1 formate/nitrite transporter [Arcobacter nitrofigilis DSM 7299]